MMINKNNKQSTMILSILIFSLVIMLSGYVFAAKGGGGGKTDVVTQAELDAAVDELNAKISAVTPDIYEIGHTFSDGSIVFWVDETGQHGLAAWPEDEASSLNWYEAGVAADAHGPGWRLPSKHELNLLFLQKGVVDGFADGWFWSSSEFSNDNAWAQNFANGLLKFNLFKVNTTVVRAVRAF